MTGARPPLRACNAHALPPPPPPPPGFLVRYDGTARRGVVRLSFRDDTVIDLGPDNRWAKALQDVARSLLTGLAAAQQR